ncbi:MAG: hypothetical protein ACXAC2_14795 [Candidatus Kariarchaeaceae archaeon]|jgi:hypothetical protein
MICHLEGLNITTPKGPTYMRPEDHQGLAEMYIAEVVNDTRVASETYNLLIGQLVETLPASEVAPPIKTDYIPCGAPPTKVTDTVTDTETQAQETDTETVTVTPGFVSPYLLFGLGLIAFTIAGKRRRK